MVSAAPSLKRAPARRQFVQHQTERELIRLRREIGLSQSLFGAHVGNSADGRAGIGPVSYRGTRGVALGDFLGSNFRQRYPTLGLKIVGRSASPTGRMIPVPKSVHTGDWVPSQTAVLIARLAF